MLEYDRIEVSEIIDVNKTNELCAWIIWNYYFLKINFRFQPKWFDGCHDLIQKASSFNYMAFVSIKGNDYRIWNIWYMISDMSKDETVNIMNNYGLKEETGSDHYHQVGSTEKVKEYYEKIKKCCKINLKINYLMKNQ